MIFTFVCNKACRHGRDMQRHENFKSWAPQSVPGAQRLASPPGIHTQWPHRQPKKKPTKLMDVAPNGTSLILVRTAARNGGLLLRLFIIGCPSQPICSSDMQVAAQTDMQVAAHLFFCCSSSAEVNILIIGAILEAWNDSQSLSGWHSTSTHFHQLTKQVQRNISDCRLKKNTRATNFISIWSKLSQSPDLHWKHIGKSWHFQTDWN